MEKMKRESFVLSKLNLPNGTPRPIFLNQFSLADDEWKKEMFTEEQLVAALKFQNIDVLLALIWRAIDDDAKRLISKVQVVKWEGTQEIEMQVEDPVEKLKLLMGQHKEILEAYIALITTLKNSVPDEVLNAEKKKKADGHLATQKSTTSSQASMDSHQSNTENSPEGRSQI